MAMPFVFLMDIDSRSFIDVMKDLSSQTGIELPKDNRDSKKLVYKREAKPVQKPQVDVAAGDKKAEAAPAQPEFQIEHDPFAEFQSMDYQEGYADFNSFEGFNTAPIQEGNLYDLLENIAQY